MNLLNLSFLWEEKYDHVELCEQDGLGIHSAIIIHLTGCLQSKIISKRKALTLRVLDLFKYWFLLFPVDFEYTQLCRVRGQLLDEKYSTILLVLFLFTTEGLWNIRLHSFQQQWHCKPTNFLQGFCSMYFGTDMQ